MITSTLQKRLLSTVNLPALPDKYSAGAVFLHWSIGLGVATCITTVKLAQWTPKDEPTKYGYTKAEFMGVHKSTAVLVAGLMFPRIGLRLFQKQPPHPPGNIVEKLGGQISHFALYALMVGLPASGIAMGYLGGKGIPFFGYTIPGASEEKKDVKTAGIIYKRHKLMGEALTYILPIHVGAVGYYYVLRSQNLLKRIWF